MLLCVCVCVCEGLKSSSLRSSNNTAELYFLDYYFSDVLYLDSTLLQVRTALMLLISASAVLCFKIKNYLFIGSLVVCVCVHKTLVTVVVTVA